jgi:hypothetical protein
MAYTIQTYQVPILFPCGARLGGTNCGMSWPGNRFKD